MAQVVIEMPYATAQTLFRDLTGVGMGSERMHTVTNQVAEGLTVLEVTLSREERERRIAGGGGAFSAAGVGAVH